MSDYEIELINIVRGSNNPTEAMIVAVKIISDFLQQNGSSEAQKACARPGPV